MNLTRTHRVGFVLALLLTGFSQTKMVEYVEDAYLMQASAPLVALADKIAQSVNFEGNYEIVSAKKAGLQINPANRFMGKGINPQTKNPFITINPEWFLNIPQEQQTFMLTRAFVAFQKGIVPFSVNVIFYMYVFLDFMFLFFIYWLLGRVLLVGRRWWVRLFAALGIVLVLEVVVFDKIELKLKSHFISLHDRKINEIVVQKTGNRDAAIKACECYDAVIKAELKDGETFWTPYATTFEDYVKALKKNN